MKDRRVRLETKLSVEIHWLDPPENHIVKAERQQAQRIVNAACETLAEELGDQLYKRMVALGAMEPIEDDIKDS